MHYRKKKAAIPEDFAPAHGDDVAVDQAATMPVLPIKTEEAEVTALPVDPPAIPSALPPPPSSTSSSTSRSGRRKAAKQTQKTRIANKRFPDTCCTTLGATTTQIDDDADDELNTQNNVDGTVHITPQAPSQRSRRDETS